MNRKVEAVVGKDVIVSDMPNYGSKDWDAYVMSQFTEDELIDGNPKCSGLRRVSRLLLGDILSSGPILVEAAKDVDGPGRATVVYQVTFLWSDGSQRIFSDVADVWHGNTDDLFAAYPAATASTRAEARALRKALAISAVSAEEITKKDCAKVVQATVKMNKPTNGELNDSAKMSEAQKKLIDSKCKQLDVNVVNFANTEEEPSLWSKKFASELIVRINTIQQGGFDQSLSGYKVNWFI